MPFIYLFSVVIFIEQARNEIVGEISAIHAILKTILQGHDEILLGSKVWDAYLL